MREIGVVKWFNPEKSSGYISNIEKLGDVYVHKTQIEDKAVVLHEGMFVTYNIDNTRNEAIKVKLLNEDYDLAILEKAFYSNRNGIWQHGFKNFLPKLKVYDEKIIEYVVRKLNKFPKYKGYLEYIPIKLLLASAELEKLIDTKTKIKIYVNYLIGQEEIITKQSELGKLADVLSHKATNSNRFWDLIPNNFLLVKVLFEIAPKRKIFEFYLEAIEQRLDEFITAETLSGFLKENPYFSDEVPETLLLKEYELFIRATPKKQVNLIWDNIATKWSALSTSALYTASILAEVDRKSVV